MNEKDTFAVWIADAMLRANSEDFAAAALADLAQQARASGDLDALLKAAASNTKRGGDFGLEFIGPLLPIILVEFGRALWEAYVKALAEEGASATIAKIKEFLRRTWSHDSPPFSLDQVEARLREVGSRSGLNQAQLDKLVTSLRGAEMAHELATI